MAYEMNKQKVNGNIPPPAEGVADVLSSAYHDAQASVGKIKEEASNKLGDAQKSLLAATRTVKGFAEDHPFYFAAATAAVGFLIGSFAYRNTTTNT